MKIDSPETSILNQITPRNNSEEGIIKFNRDGSLRPRRIYRGFPQCLK